MLHHRLNGRSTLRALLLASVVALAAGNVFSAAHAEPARVEAPAFTSDRLSVEVIGQGPDVILIPGFASSREVWRPLAQRLAATHRVHLVQLAGFAGEPWSHGDGAFVQPAVDELARYAATLNKPAVIGHSMGGQIALRVAADAGPRVGRVMVVDASPFFPSLISAGATTGDVEPLARLAYQGLLLLGDGALRTQAANLGVEMGGASDSLFGTLGWQGGDRRTLAQGLYEVMTVDLRARLPAITAPVTVVYGWSADDRSPRSHIDGLFRAGYRSLPHPAAFERIEGAEHMVMIDQPRRFQAAVERFLR